MYVAPKPYGGPKGLKDLIAQELQYPHNALKAGIEGNVELMFTVTKNGGVKNLQVFIPLEPECDKEAMRVARLVRWHPAERGGLPVSTEYTLKVKFDDKKYKKYLKARAENGAVSDLPRADSNHRLWNASELDTLPVPLVANGMNGLSSYFAANMQYPVEAFKRNLQGTAVVEFVVEPSGGITNIEIIEPVGGGCNEEAYRLLQSMRWRPAVKNGLSVRTIMNVEIEFRLVAPE
jgi:TonB family protein